MKDLKRIESFLSKLNSNPPQNSIKEMPRSSFNPTAYKYVPISHVQTTLDELFFGLWSTANFKPMVVANELVGQVDLKVFHPIANEWITRTGFASVAIQQNKGASVTQIEQKKKKALELDAPKLLTECIKNAAKHLGNIFGRNLNRKSDTVDNYRPILTIQDKQKAKSIEATKKEELVGLESVAIRVEKCNTIEELKTLFSLEMNNITADDKKLFSARRENIEKNAGK